MSHTGSYAPRGLSDEEAEELLKHFRPAYLSPNDYPHLVRLVQDLELWAAQMKAVAS